jgi:hypothetical protein
MFGGMRDLYQTFGYKRAPTFHDYLFKYMKQDIAGRIIDAPVDALWTDAPIVNADEAFLGAWQDVVSAHSVWSVLCTLDRLCGLGRYAVLVIGIDDGLALEKPVVEPRGGSSPRVRKVIYLQPYMEGSVQIQAYETDTTSPRFGKPTMYQVTPQSPDINAVALGGASAGSVSSVGGQRNSFLVHHTRVLHVADNTLENKVFGIPRLANVYNRLDDLEKVVGGAAETFWMAGNRGLQVDVDKEMDLDPEAAKALEQEVETYVNDMRRFIKTRGVKINPLGSDVADPSRIFDVLVSLIAAAKGIPKRVLIGVEAGQLASAQDRANWAQRVAERQQNHGSPVVLIPFISTLVRMGVLPNPATLTITWPEAFKLSPLERAQTSAQLGRTAANLQKMISDPIGAVKVQETVTEGGSVDPETGVSTGGTKVTVRTWIEGGAPLLDNEEARGIVGMGKTMPVYDGTGAEDVALKS